MPDRSSRLNSKSGARARAARRWAVAIVGVAYWGNAIRLAARPGTGGLDAVWGAILQNGAFRAAAWAMLGVIAWRKLPAAPGSLAGLALLSLACLVAALPASQACMVAMLLLALHFAWAGAPGRAAALLLAGLAADSVWTSPYLMPLHAACGRLDAALIRGLAGAGGSFNVVTTAVPGFDVEILGPCASSFPLAAVALAYAVTRLLDGRLPGRRDLPWLLLAWGVSIGLTETRLALMTRGPVTYTWLHDGGGVTVYALLATAAAFLVPVLAGSAPLQAQRRPA
jgi:hypothetical protein